MAPTIIGYAAVDSNLDGSTTIHMYSALENGIPRQEIARHTHLTTAPRIESGVRMKVTDNRRVSDRVVEMVTSATGEVTLRARQSG